MTNLQLTQLQQIEQLKQLRQLHDEIDRRASDIAAQNARRLQCRRGCSSCCVDDLTVFEVEASRIVEANGTLLREGTPHPVGACAFLDTEGACRIYADRPYVCRTQGLPLRWYDSDSGCEPGSDSGEVIEIRDICELNIAGPALEDLPESACWEIGPTESVLAGLQSGLDGGENRRVSLRSLFASTQDLRRTGDDTK